MNGSIGRPAEPLDIDYNGRRNIRRFLTVQLINHEKHKTTYTVIQFFDLLFNKGNILIPFQVVISTTSRSQLTS